MGFKPFKLYKSIFHWAKLDSEVACPIHSHVTSIASAAVRDQLLSICCFMNQHIWRSPWILYDYITRCLYLSYMYVYLYTHTYIYVVNVKGTSTVVCRYGACDKVGMQADVKRHSFPLSGTDRPFRLSSVTYSTNQSNVYRHPRFSSKCIICGIVWELLILRPGFWGFVSWIRWALLI